MAEPFSSGTFRPPGIRSFASLDEEIAADVESIRTGMSPALYGCDRFKQEKHGIDIFYPYIEYPAARPYIKGPDHIRYLLSIYPDPADLRLIDTIILRPRHIESAGVELMALYIRRTKTLVQYLYSPHSCDISASISAQYNEFHPFDMTRMINRAFHGADRDNDTQVAPLLYLISLLPDAGGNDIDKFLLRHDSAENGSVRADLDGVSSFYSRYGY
ncbi:MAG: hypothetical protein ACRCUT_05895 [Spirochaetota bacterium]